MIRQRGDTIVEVVFAVTVFAMVAVGGITLMNHGEAVTERALEIDLVRAQIGEQADALHYVHDAYITSSDPRSQPVTIWHDVTAYATSGAVQSLAAISNGQQCVLPSIPATNSAGAPFALDARKLNGQSANGKNTDSPVLTFAGWSVTKGDVPLSQPPGGVPAGYQSVTYAQVRYPSMTDYNQQAVSQGIWIQAVYIKGTTSQPGYYDFHISACWQATGSANPMTLGTIVRLYDPAA